jgi:steroid delta-isomerase-like uncharacterized protein
MKNHHLQGVDMSNPHMAAEDVVARYVEEVWNQRKVQFVDELLTPDHVRRDSVLTDAVVGRKAVKAQVLALKAAFPDFHFDVWIIPSESGEFVTRRWTMTGAHLGEWLDVPATGISVTSTGMAISRIENGLIAEEWVQRDDLGLLRQIRAVSW